LTHLKKSSIVLALENETAFKQNFFAGFSHPNSFLSFFFARIEREIEKEREREREREKERERERERER